MNNADQPLHLWQTDLASLPERKIQQIFHASNNNCITVQPNCQGENQLEFQFNILFPVYIQFCIFDFENATLQIIIILLLLQYMSLLCYYLVCS